eukprot:Protomagalhaensia_sp_Gyna_25__3161@NODE_2890_length_832_cov_227_187894_g2415_i0_p1_GENE_NODE_2890_length_832_cov_227_187894_g2415_i0NODE_2890_length_832_cov_227_187894_g2415_i0_p1_ORF_typecomplete_len164_score33_23ANAPC3/PF12895_7/0_014Cohesin_load/PF10345_9/0_04TPR_19/PF14559_6/0_15HMD/PF03201_16/0_19_NODE_2890_length_832_cov_227_187894_g2415_i0271762
MPFNSPVLTTIPFPDSDTETTTATNSPGQAHITPNSYSQKPVIQRKVQYDVVPLEIRHLTVSDNVVEIELCPHPSVERGSSTDLRSEAQQEDLKGDYCYLENNVEQALSHYRQAQYLNQKEPMYEFKIAASLKRISRLSESRKIIEKVLAEIDKDMKKADEVR